MSMLIELPKGKPIVFAGDAADLQENIGLEIAPGLCWHDREDRLEIVADTCGRQDTLGGVFATESNTVRYALEKKCMHACRDNWMLEIAENEEFGTSKRDITHNINFLLNVPITADGGLTFDDGISAPGKYVEMKACMSTIVLISNCPQLNNPCRFYDPTHVEVLIWDCWPERLVFICFKVRGSAESL